MTATSATTPRPTATKTHPAGVRPRDPAYRSRSQSRTKQPHPTPPGATNLNALDLQTWTILKIVPALAKRDDPSTVARQPLGTAHPLEER